MRIVVQPDVGIEMDILRTDMSTALRMRPKPGPSENLYGLPTTA